MEPIDIVIIWVDGEDPIHKAKRRKFLGNGRGETFAEVAAPTRFRSVGEIYFCIASILRFAPFVHHIYIVTDAQNPHADRFAARFFPESHIPITVVDHRTIFRDYEDLLPTFNSLSIETMLWRIPGLSERFVYFNDDVLLVAPVSPSDWYDEAGQPIIYGYWHCTWTARLVRWLRLPKHGHRTFTYKDSMLNAADVLGGEARKRFVRMIHASLPLQRSFFEQFYGQHPELLVENARWRFRNPHQFNPQSLFITYLALHNRCVLRPQGQTVIYLAPRPERIKKVAQSLRAAIVNRAAKICCINSLDMGAPEQQLGIVAWIGQRLGIDFLALRAERLRKQQAEERA